MAQRAVERHMVEAETHRFADRATGATCPVCYMEPASPFRLGCGHEYCTACAKLLLSSATDNKTFPLLCVGNDATCGVPIPIPTIRKFLTDGLHLNEAGYAVRSEVWRGEGSADFDFQIVFDELVKTIKEKHPEYHYDNLQFVFVP